MSSPQPSLTSLPPNAVESEQALIGIVLSHPKSAAVCHELTEEDFFEPLHGRLFKAIMGQWEASGTVTPLPLMSQFREDETLKTIGVPPSQFIAGLLANAQPHGSAPFLAKQIKNDAMLRRLAEMGQGLSARSYKPNVGETAADVAAEAIESIAQIAATGLEGKKSIRFNLHESVTNIAERLNNVFMHGELPNDSAFAGSHKIGEVLGGWRRGRYYVIGGRPGMGKTTVGTALLFETAKRGGNVLFFSLEMGNEELGERILSSVVTKPNRRLEYQRIARSDVNVAEMEDLMAAQYDLQNVPFLVIDKPALTLAQVRAITMREMQRLENNGKRLDVVCIDHMGLMRASDRYKGNKVAETEEISAALKAMAKEFDVAVIALVQLNRGVEGRDDKRPTLSDLRWSGAIEQDADVVMFCYRPAYYLERQKCDDLTEEMERKDKLEQCRNALEVQFAKHRGGPCPLVEMYCDMGCAIVRDEK